LTDDGIAPLGSGVLFSQVWPASAFSTALQTLFGSKKFILVAVLQLHLPVALSPPFRQEIFAQSNRTGLQQLAGTGNSLLLACSRPIHSS
jgi:hypothetical protein